MTVFVAGAVVVKIVGGLGNQLFCYAAGRRLAFRTGAELVLDLNFFRSDVRYAREYRLDRFLLGPHSTRQTTRLLPPELDMRLWRVRRKFAQWGLVPGVQAIVERDAKEFMPELLDPNFHDRILLDGYWQDERYFSDIRDTLLTEFSVRDHISARNAEQGARLREEKVAVVHCRRHHHQFADGSRQRPRARESLTAGYYAQALERLREAGNIEGVYLFGDDPEWLLANLPTDLPAVVVDWNRDRGGEVLDLWLMMQGRYFVVSNSTLSWWGAWLSAAQGVHVIAPRAQDLEYWVANAQHWQEIDW
jgi:hypothetical protein